MTKTSGDIPADVSGVTRKDVRRLAMSIARLIVTLGGHEVSSFVHSPVMSPLEWEIELMGCSFELAFARPRFWLRR